MSSVITPVSEYDTSSALTVPSNGDDLDADVVKDVLQVISDRAELAKDSVLGLLLGAESFEVAAGGTRTSFTITLGNIRAAVLECADGVIRSMSATGISITQTSVEGGGGDLTAAAAWWYVYLYSASGTLAYEISTTAPTADLTWKTGSVGEKRYVGCFRTTAAGVPIAVRAHRGRYLYRISDMAANATQVLATGTAGSFTDVDCSAFVPPHARFAEINAALVPNAGTAGAQMRMDGAASSGVIALSCDANVGVDKTFTLELSSARVMEYRIASGAPNGLYLDVMGFTE